MTKGRVLRPALFCLMDIISLPGANFPPDNPLLSSGCFGAI